MYVLGIRRYHRVPVGRPVLWNGQSDSVYLLCNIGASLHGSQYALGAFLVAFEIRSLFTRCSGSSSILPIHSSPLSQR